MTHVITALDDEVCDFCAKDIEAGQLMFRIKSRLGHHLVCDDCHFVQEVNP